MYFSEHQNDCQCEEQGMWTCLVNCMKNLLVYEHGVVKGGE